MELSRWLILLGALLLLALAIANVIWAIRKVSRAGRAIEPASPRVAPPPAPRSPVEQGPPSDRAPEHPDASDEAPPPAAPVADDPEVAKPAVTTPPPPEAPAPSPPTHPSALREEESRAAASDEPTYAPASSVELRFHDDDSRVGVKPGSETHAKYVKLADDLLSELARSCDGPEASCESE